MSKEASAAVKPNASGIKPGVKAFYSPRESAGPKIELWVNQNEAEGAPAFDGVFDDLPASAYFRQGKKGNFLAIFCSTPGENGRHAQLATAQVIANVAGLPKLAVNLGSRTVWAEVSKTAPIELLVQAGLDLERQAQKKEQYLRSAKS